MVWGESLLETNYLESKVAYYPRIIIDTKLVKELSPSEIPYDDYTNFSLESKNYQESILFQYFKRDKDYIFYLDYLKGYSTSKNPTEKDDDLNKLKLYLQQHIEKLQNCNMSIRPKLFWQYSYLQESIDLENFSSIVNSNNNVVFSKKDEDYLEYKEIKTTDHLIAYVNILDSEDMIKKEQNQYLKTIYGIYEDIKAVIKDYNDGFSSTKYYPKDSIKIKIFSHYILFSIKLVFHPDNQNTNEDLVDFIIFLKSIDFAIRASQLFFLKNNILLSGGLVRGELFHNEQMLWGKGLINAYKLEQSTCKLPKITVDDSIIDDVKKYSNLNDACKNTLEPFFIKDVTTGHYITDYLTSDLKGVTYSSINNLLNNFPPKENILTKEQINWQKWYLKKKLKLISHK